MNRSQSVRAAGAAAAVTAALALAGCEDPKALNNPPKPVDRVDQITVMAVPPAAVNWDAKPGADGVQIMLFFFRSDKAVLVNGTVEFLLYEGPVARREVLSREPFYVWRFTSEELARYQGRGRGIWGYARRLPWGPKAPESGSVTLVARYTSPTGGEVYSAPTTVAMKPD